MVLGQMINYNSGGIKHGSELASGVTIESIPAASEYVKKIMARAGKLPRTASPQTVMNAEKVAAAMKDNAKFLNDLVQVKLEQADAGLEVLEASAALDKGMATRETRYQKIMDGVGRSQLDSRYQQGRIQAANEGSYQAHVSVFDSL